MLSIAMDPAKLKQDVLSYRTIDPAHEPCLGAMIEYLGGALGESKDRELALRLARVCFDRAAEAYEGYPFARARWVQIDDWRQRGKG